MKRCRDQPGFADAAAILEAAWAPPPETVEGDYDTKSRLIGFVYLARGHKDEYKIGRTNLVDRRLAEIGTKSAVELKLIHEIKTDDPVGIERYWHQRFAANRMRGEWFRLTVAEVNTFRRWHRIW